MGDDIIERLERYAAGTPRANGSLHWVEVGPSLAKAALAEIERLRAEWRKNPNATYDENGRRVWSEAELAIIQEMAENAPVFDPSGDPIERPCCVDRSCGNYDGRMVIDHLYAEIDHHVAGIVNRDDEIERLRRWKAEAIEVLKGWDALVELIEVQLGDRKSDAVAAEIERLRTERDDERKLANQLARILRLCINDRPTAHTDVVWEDIHEGLAAYKEVRRG